MKKAECSSDQDPFRQILSSVIQKRLDTGINPHAYPSLLKEVMQYVQQIIDGLETSGQAPEIACKNGCHYCCYSQVTIIPLEALLIFSFVQEHFSVQEQDRLKQRLAASVLLTKGKDLEQRFSVKHENPCVFLGEGSCTIYPVRPLICRSWNSLELSSCRIAFESDDCDTLIEDSPVRNYVFGTARGLFQELAVNMELESAFLNIPHAVTCCYSAADPLLAWARGDQLFKYGK